MAGYEVSVGKELLPGLLSGQDGLAKLVETVLNQILEAQVTEMLNAERFERTEERVGYRNGARARTRYTRVGPVTLLVPQTRDGSFSRALSFAPLRLTVKPRNLRFMPLVRLTPLQRIHCELSLTWRVTPAITFIVAAWMDSKAGKGYIITWYHYVIRGPLWQHLSRSTTR